MVDFSNDSIVSRPPTEVINIIVIEHWYNCRVAWQHYFKHRLAGAGVSTSEFRSRISSLYLSVIELLLRKDKLKPEEINLLNKVCTTFGNFKEDDILKCYLIINRELDKSNLVKVDTKPFINRHSIEGSNKAHGF
jgi:hypothetical protein